MWTRPLNSIEHSWRGMPALDCVVAAVGGRTKRCIRIGLQQRLNMSGWQPRRVRADDNYLAVAGIQGANHRTPQPVPEVTRPLFGSGKRILRPTVRWRIHA